MTETKGNNSKSINARVCSARRLMLIALYMKFREDSLNCFQMIERTRFFDIVQGKKLKSINAIVMVLVNSTSSNVDCYLCNVS